MKRVILNIFLILALVLAFSSTAFAQGDVPVPDQAGKKDDLAHPLGQQQRALRQEALEAQLNGKAYGRTHEVARGQFVELERMGEDSIWTVLADFGDEISPIPELQSPEPGPQHNQIPEPDRNYDNTTIWVPDFSRDHYLDLLFSEAPGDISMRNYYIEQSSNRYTVNGDVTDWAQVEYNTAHYGRYDSTVWWFVDESVDDWYARQFAAGQTDADIADYLSQFDVWDRYDYNGNGNFDEPDGYIDHFQSVHAGMGEEAGGGAYGADAIWSHRWYANYPDIGTTGPSFNLAGGVQIGNTDYWIGDYTIEPENGGVGVFAHEYAHDLGVPDLYDYTGENATGFWTLMSSGSWLSQNNYDIGSQPNHFGVWEKFQLGWLNYEVAYAGSKSEHKLGPAETNTKQAQGLFVLLPDKGVTEDIGPPFAGDYYYYSGAGHYLDNFMSKPFSLAAGSTLTAKVNYQIEGDWDYAYLVVSNDGGATWSGVETNLSTTTNPNGQNFGYGITGSSGGWVDLTADLPAGDVLLGFRYWTDPNTGGFGFKVDDIQITDQPLDGAEADAGWTFDGFKATNGIESAYYFNAYVAEFRQYRGYDAGLANAYNFGWGGVPDLGNWVEHFPYQDGLLISYWDNSFADNNVGANCGGGRCGGLLLPVDAHPDLMIRADGGNWRNRVQTYDSTFGLDATDAITLHWRGEESYHASQPAVSIFDDNLSYYNSENPMGSVITPQTGTQIRVKSISAHNSFMQVEVRPSK